jgi:hypothetical protein
LEGRYKQLRSALITAVYQALGEGLMLPGDDEARNSIFPQHRALKLALGFPCVECRCLCWDGRHRTDFGGDFPEADADHRPEESNDTGEAGFRLVLLGNDGPDPLILDREGDIFDAVGVEGVCNLLDALAPPPALESALPRFLLFGEGLEFPMPDGREEGG